MRVKCLAQENNTMSPARARIRTARSEVKRRIDKPSCLPMSLPYQSFYAVAVTVQSLLSQ